MEHARVLIVDDEPFARQTLSEWLREQDYDVLEAESGRQAMERIRKDKPDIVISDMVMPGMDGLQLLKEAKAARADASFLMVTGYPSPSVAVNVMQHGASDYMIKPFNPGELSRRVKRMLLHKSLEKPQAAAKGMILGTALSAILWALTIGAIYTFFS
jgi:two-component system, cell cycle response regulator